MPIVPIDRLQPGVFINIQSVPWLEHPFLLNRFRITHPRQIQALRQMGLTAVEWEPERSSAPLLPEKLAASEEEDLSSGALLALLDNKRDRVRRVQEKREDFARSARLFEQETGMVRQVISDLGARPNEAHARGKAVVDRLVGGLIGSSSVAVHLVNLKKPEIGLPGHAMNVMALSLLIGRRLGLGEDEMKQLGLGAMLHDVGHQEIPPRVLRNPHRSEAEEQYYRAHTGYGLKVVAPLKDLAVAIKNIIACHHERWDGTGYPNGLVGSKIPRLARIVAIANRYDNLCNPSDGKPPLTPAEAVGLLFRNECSAHDPDILGAFIKSLGIYPPGTFVALNDGSIGLVIESKTSDLLHPLLMIYDASVPRTEALLLDLAEADEVIERAVLPGEIPKEIVEYLAPQGRIDYYVEGSA